MQDERTPGAPRPSGGRGEESDRWLSEEEENRLLREVRSPKHRGAAEERLVRELLGLVYHHAIGAARRSEAEREELVSEGLEALLHAIRKFDPAKGTRLSSYASVLIRNAVAEAARGHVSPEFSPIDHEDGAELAPSTEDVFFERGEVERLYRALASLCRTDVVLVTHRFGLFASRAMSQLAAADELGMTRKAMRFAEERALERLRRAIRREERNRGQSDGRDPIHKV